MMTPFDSIPHLSSQRWENAMSKARNQVIAGLVEPKYADFEEITPGIISPKARRYLIAALVLIAIAAFWISAGKQISASTMLFEPIAKGQKYLSELWSALAIIAGLTLGEAGTISFSVFASVFAGQPIMFRGLQIRPRGLMFRILSVLCAGVAILANVTITAMHNNAGFDVFAWFVTLIPPIVVIGIGIVIEAMVLQGHMEREGSERKYRAAHQEYEFYCSHPEKHGTYNRRWFLCIFEELNYAPMTHKHIVDIVKTHGEAAKGQIVLREIAAHDFWAQLEGQLANPTLPPASEVSNWLAPSSEPQVS